MSAFDHAPAHLVDQKHAQTAELLDAMVAGWRDEIAGLPETAAWLASTEAVINTVTRASGEDLGRYAALLAATLALAVGRLAGGEDQ